MAYVLITNGVVVQKQPNAADGFIEAPDHVVCGWSFDGATFFYEPPVPQPYFLDIPRPAFLFMMHKIGVTEGAVEELIGQMPEGDERTLALFVFRNQQSFRRDNSLLASLASAAGLSSETIDTAWRAAESLTW